LHNIDHSERFLISLSPTSQSDVTPSPLAERGRGRGKIFQHRTFVDVEEPEARLCTTAPSLSFGEG